jgi:cell division protein ZapA (FtsZ GTPase activity inhibitor)
MTVEMEGLTPLQIMELARQVDEKISEMQRHNEKIADTSKLAILAALDFCTQLHQLKDASATERNAVENKLNEFSLALKSALTHIKR